MKKEEIIKRKAAVRTRKDLYALLADKMTDSYDGLVEDQRLEGGMVKSYLLESHLDSTNIETSFSNLLTRIEPKWGVLRFSVEELKEPELLKITVNHYQRKTKHHLFIDCSKKRFWTVYSIDDAAMIDAALSKLILSDCSLDHVWLPETFLMTMRHWGELRAIKLNHDRREMLAGTKKQAARRNEKLGMELKGLFVEDGLEFFVQNTRTRDYANLSAIQIRRLSNGSPDHENAGFSIDDVKFTGKFTTRGTSFEQHLKLIETTRDRYSSVIIDQIEDKALELRQGRVKGNFFIFRYERRIDDFERFIDYTFSGSEPFRLWALPTQLSKDAYRVVGTDIHSGSQFHAEVFPTYMRFYLHKGSCGNTVSRLWTNLQTYYSGTTELLDSQGEEFVSF